MNRRARILHVYKDYFPPVIGGVENTMNLMARGVLDEFDVDVLVCSGSGHESREVVDGVRVTRVPEWGRIASAPVSPGFTAAMRRLASQADLLHFHHPNPTGDFAYVLARANRPVVITYHSDVIRQKYLMKFYAPVQERVMKAARVIMPTSPNYVESSPWLGRFRNKCHVVPLGVDLSRFEKTQEIEARAKQIREHLVPPIVLFVGRLRYYKGLEFLIEAITQVDATLLVVGSGPEFVRLRALADYRRITPRSRFVGEVPDEELTAHYYAADVFCMPSHLRSEAFGLSQVEAMACGRPVVSCRIASGVPFVNQHGVTGTTVEPANPDALARAIREIISNDELRQNMGQAARERAHALFSAHQMCDNIKRVYRHVICGEPLNTTDQAL